MIFILLFLFAEMDFRNFVVAGGAKEVIFLPQDPKEASYGVGSLSVSVNKNDIDALAIEPIASTKPTKPAKPTDTEETAQLVENVTDSDDPPSKEEQVMIVGSSDIADRVRSRKWASQRNSQKKAHATNPYL